MRRIIVFIVNMLFCFALFSGCAKQQYGYFPENVSSHNGLYNVSCSDFVRCFNPEIELDDLKFSEFWDFNDSFKVYAYVNDSDDISIRVSVRADETVDSGLYYLQSVEITCESSYGYDFALVTRSVLQTLYPASSSEDCKAALLEAYNNPIYHDVDPSNESFISFNGSTITFFENEENNSFRYYIEASRDI